MPRYYRRRYTRVVKPKKKWATNIRNITLDTGSTALATNQIGMFSVLCDNSVGSSTPTPTIIKTGNYKVQCDAHIVTSASVMVNIRMYIMYIPEGVFDPTGGSGNPKYQGDHASLSAIVSRHPEWILSWKQFSSDFFNSDTNLDKVSFSSRLKRNLNSGDQIMAVILADTVAYGGQGINAISRLIVNGTCQFWTCTN